MYISHFGLYSPQKGYIKDVRLFSFNVETIEGGFGNNYSKLPITVKNTELIYKTIENEQEDRVWDLKVYDGIPEISFSSTNRDKCTLYVARYYNDTWHISSVAEGATVYYPAGIVIDEKNENKVAIGIISYDGCAEIGEWITKDMKAWKRERTITNHSICNQFRPQYIKKLQ